MAIVLCVIIGCVIGIVSLLTIRVNRRKERIALIKSKYRQRNRAAASGVAGRSDRAQTRQDRAAGEPAALPIALARLEPPPEGVCIPGGRPSTEDVPEPIVNEAKAVSRTIIARRAILKGVVTKSQEPRELTKIVVRDPALAGQILKTVNSAFYGLRYPVGSVFRAVLLLGHIEVRNIIWRTCVGEAMGPEKGPTSESLDSIWRHSFATSRVAYALARSLGLADPDEISTTALLHDIGKILYLKVQPFVGLSVYGSCCFSDHERLTEEQSQLGLSHAALGHKVARIWGMPRGTCEAIALHHEPSYVQPEEVDGDPRAIAVVYLADILCHNARIQPSVEQTGKIYLPKDGWLKMLGAQEGLEALCSESVVRALSLQRVPGVEDHSGTAEHAYAERL
jgi:putative nucleotidyltransferase with HDIG domain